MEIDNKTAKAVESGDLNITKQVTPNNVPVYYDEKDFVNADGTPTEEELHTLRRVSGKVPWTAYTVAFVELCERFSYYGTTAVCKCIFYQDQVENALFLRGGMLIWRFISHQLHPAADAKELADRCRTNC